MCYYFIHSKILRQLTKDIKTAVIEYTNCKCELSSENHRTMSEIESHMLCHPG